MPRRWRVATIALAPIAALAIATPAGADGTVTGHARFERIAGRPAMDHVELYESNLFLSPDGGVTRGPSFRLGAPQGQAPRGDGYYSLSVPAGTWSILVNQPLFFIRPKVLSGVTVADGGTTARHVELPIDYSTFFTDEWTEWEQIWVQTFVATGRSISGVSWKLAGTSADEIEAAVLVEDPGEPNPARWPLASPRARKTDSVASLTDNWVRWRSGQVPTEPGTRYAVRLSGVSGGDRKFAVFKRDKDASSYADGRAYDAAGRAQGFDLNVTVFSDNDGTVVLYNKTTEGLGDLRDGYFGGRWGQTFRATAGTSLAAVDVWAAGADRHWDLDFTFSVHRGGPGGARVGPVKTTAAAYQAFGAGLHGASYNPGEVPLEPGETYYVEFTNPEGFNPYVMDDARDAYADGAAYQDRQLRDGGSVDLSMTIITYVPSDVGAVAGRVVEAGSGRAIAAATVTAVELGRAVTTDGSGRYTLADVPAGTWTLRAAKTGYETATRSGVEVPVGETAAVDFALEREPCEFAFRNGGFEDGLTGWTRYGDARNRVVDTSGGGWFADIVASEGARFHGNEINGCCLNGGLFQRACATPGHRIRVTAWSNVYWISGGSDRAENRIGIDPGGGADADGPVVWGAVHRQPLEAVEGWRQLAVEAVAAGPVVTVFLDFRQRSSGGNQWRINCFDLVEIEDLDAGAGPPFARGDCDGNGSRDIADAVSLLVHLFRAPRALGCLDACDANDAGGLDVTDAVFFLEFLFAGGPRPPAPGGACAPDATPGDELDCETSNCG